MQFTRAFRAGIALHPISSSMRMAYSFLWRMLRFLQLHRVPGLIKVVMPEEANPRGGITLVNELQPKYSIAWRRLQRMEVVLGDYLEFGVSRGKSFACMHSVVKQLNLTTVRLFGFDSFEGMPSCATWEDHGTWKPGQFASTMDATAALLNQHDVDWARTNLVKGWFDETLKVETAEKLGIKKASVITIDCHLHSATKAALNFAKPLIEDFAVIFFSDWQSDRSVGEHRAYAEFLDENPHLKSKDFGEYRPAGRIFFVINTQEGG